jgi:hypothetical protein
MIFRIGKLCGRRSGSWKPKLFETPRTSARDRLRDGSGSAQASNPPTAQELGETRLALITEAQRVADLRKMKVAEVVNRAAKGAFTYEQSSS